MKSIKKSIIILLVMFTVMTIFGGVVNAASASVSVRASKTSDVKIGETVKITVSFSQPVTTATFTLKYDSAKLQYISDTIGGTNSGNTVKVDYIDLQGLKSITSASFTFKTKAEGTANCSVSGVTISDADANELTANIKSSASIKIVKDQPVVTPPSDGGSNTGSNNGSNTGSNTGNTNTGNTNTGNTNTGNTNTGKPNTGKSNTGSSNNNNNTNNKTENKEEIKKEEPIVNQEPVAEENKEEVKEPETNELVEVEKKDSKTFGQMVTEIFTNTTVLYIIIGILVIIIIIETIVIIMLKKRTAKITK